MLEECISKRFPNLGMNGLSAAYANFIDPRLKGVHLEEVGLFSKVKQGIIDSISWKDTSNEYVSLAEAPHDNEQFESNEDITPTERLLQKKRSETFSESQAGDGNKKSGEEEVNVYLELPRCFKDDDILHWWNTHKEVLPRMSEISRQTLHVPASSSSSERLFSAAGEFDTVKRAKLSVETFEDMTLMKNNRKVLEEFCTESEESLSSEDEIEEFSSEKSSTDSSTESEWSDVSESGGDVVYAGSCVGDDDSDNRQEEESGTDSYVQEMEVANDSDIDYEIPYCAPEDI